MKLGIIGFGNLGKSFVSGLIKSGVNQYDICINARTQKTRDSVKEIYPDISVINEKADVIECSDIVVLIVEPQNTDDLCREICSSNLNNKIIVSFISGISISYIRTSLSTCTGEFDIVRAMPNIAISSGNGVIGFSHNTSVEKAKVVKTLFEKLGTVIEVGEEELENITVSAACGLAFASVLMNAYQNSITGLMKDKKMEKDITLKVFEGVVSLIKDRNITFEQLNSLVTTRGGSTEAGLENMNVQAINTEVAAAVASAYNHTRRQL